MTTLHFVPHTHWDREWYQTFEVTRLRLIHLVDLLLDVFHQEPRYAHFMLDGQTIILDDYLEIRPDREREIEEHVRAGRLLIGPWYVLPDEFLVSPEALVRNLLQGAKDCARFGERMGIGYLPDPFGHIGQMPQILRGFGIEAAAFRRGLADEPPEIWWEAPDGSRVLTAYLRDGYGNAAHAPTEAQRFAGFVAQLRDSLLPHSASDHLLLLNGTDHQEPRIEMASLIADYRSDFHRLLFSTLPAYMQALEEEIQRKALELPVVRGEARNPKRHHLLPGVLSSRVWIKQRNHDCETLLERWAEPFAAWAETLCGEQPSSTVWTGHLTAPRLRRPSALLENAWRLLMQCHPHDSICGCSIDQVHEEMRTRFDRVEQIGEAITRQSLSALAESVDTSKLSALYGDAALVTFNPISGPRTDLVIAELELPAGMDPFEIIDEAENAVPFRIVGRQARPIADFSLDADGLRGMLAMAEGGQVLGAAIRSFAARKQGEQAMIDVVLSETAQPDLQALQEGWSAVQRLLEDDCIRRYHLRARFPTVVTVQLIATDVPGHGYRSLIMKSSPRPSPEQIEEPGDTIENEHLRLTVEQDGTFTLMDKTQGLTFPGLLRFSDQGDRGDSYTFCPVEGDEAIEQADGKPAVRRLVDSLGQSLEVRFSMDLPLGLAEDRRSRLPQTTKLPITVRASLLHGVPRADVTVELHNTLRDHRLRLLFPLPFPVERADFDGHYEIVARSTAIQAGGADWVEQPVVEQPMRTFVAGGQDGTGLMVAARGLREASVTEQGLIALTLLRCFGWLSLDDLATRNGGAGPKMPVPGGQSPGAHTFLLSLIPFAGSLLEASAHADAFQAPMRAVASGLHPGRLPPRASLLSFDHPALRLSCVKAAEDGDGLIVRIVNLSGEASRVHLKTLLPLKAAWKVRLDESPLAQLRVKHAHELQAKIGSHEVLSLRLRFAE